jgi:hypothetical protein
MVGVWCERHRTTSPTVSGAGPCLCIILTDGAGPGMLQAVVARRCGSPRCLLHRAPRRSADPSPRTFRTGVLHLVGPTSSNCVNCPCSCLETTHGQVSKARPHREPFLYGDLSRAGSTPRDWLPTPTS